MEKANWEEAVLKELQSRLYPAFDLITVAQQIDGGLRYNPDKTPQEWVTDYLEHVGLTEFSKDIRKTYEQRQ